MRKPALAVVAVGCLSVAAGCASTPASGTESPSEPAPAMVAPESMRPLAGRWVVETIDGEPVRRTEMPARLEFTMMGGVVGFTGMNHYSTRSTVGVGGVLTLSPGITTKRAGPPEEMEAETAFLNAMNRVNGALVGDGRLALTSDGKVVMTLVREQRGE